MIEHYTFGGFLVTCVFALAIYAKHLTKKIIYLTDDCSKTMQDVRNAVANNTSAMQDNSTAIRELRSAIHNNK